MGKFNLQQNALMQQGYCTYTKSNLKSISNGLRFTPLLCMFLALYGLILLQNPYWHFAIASLGILPFWFPKAHPFDLLYNKVIRHLVGGVKLPANPLPRRIACVMGGLMNVGIGFSFYYGSTIVAYGFGIVLIALQTIVITTHICIASVMYQGLLKLFGKYDGPIDIDKAKKLIKDGFTLIDVRSPEEYSEGKIQGAINVPLEIIEECDDLPKKGMILYCRSGIRSLDAMQKLSKMGYNNILNLGSKDRWYE